LLGAVILTYVWRFQDLFPVVRMLRLPILASLGALALFVLDQDPNRKLKRARHPITAAVTLILVMAVLSVPLSIYQGHSFRFVLDDLVKTVLMFLVLASSIRCVVDLRRFLGIFVLGAAAYALYVHLFISVGSGGRLGAIVYYDANDLGMCLVTTLPIAVFFAMRARNGLLRLAMVGVLGLLLLVLVKTGSRGAFLGLLAVGGYLLVMLKEIPVHVRAGVVVAVFAGLLFFAGDRYWELMSTLLNPTEDYNWSGNSDSGRMAVWKRGIGYMLANPVLGLGARAFPVAEGTISELAYRQQLGLGLKWSDAHNSFVQVGAELGIIGLGAFCAALFQGFKASYGRSKEVLQGDSDTAREYRLLGQILAGSLLGYAVTGFFLSQAYAALLYVLLALIVGYVRATPEAPAGDQPAVVRRRTWSLPAHMQPAFHERVGS
jgi:O-antigen ligase